MRDPTVANAPPEEEYATGAPFAERARLLLGHAVLAPSSHNSQPWLFRVDADAIEVIADRRRALPVVDPEDRELTISCGAAVGFAEIAARRFGCTARVAVGPDSDDPDLLARIRLDRGAEPTAEEVALFEAMAARRTNRTPFRPEAVPQDLLDSCAAEAAAHGVVLRATAEPTAKRTVADLVAEGDREQFHDPRFRRELASWIHSQRLGSRDGMSSAGFGVPDVLAPIARLVIRSFDLGDDTAASDAQKIDAGSPALVLLASNRDEPAAWVATGRTLARVLLRLTAAGVAASYLNQPIETARLRPGLARAFGVAEWPQILLRVGRAESTPPAAPRRPVAEVMLS